MLFLSSADLFQNQFSLKNSFRNYTKSKSNSFDQDQTRHFDILSGLKLFASYKAKADGTRRQIKHQI